MDLMSLLNDLVGRFRLVEDEYISRINEMDKNITQLDEHYKSLKKHKSFWLRFIVILSVWVLGGELIPLIFKEQLPKLPFLDKIEAAYDALLPANVIDFTEPTSIFMSLWLPLMSLIFVISIIELPFINVIREKRARDWWENVGKIKSVELVRSIEELSQEATGILAQNPLYERFPDCWRNTRDCARIGNIVLQRRAFSLEEAFSVYDDILDREYEKKQEREERQRISENIAALTNEIREIDRREQRDRIARDLAVDNLLWDLRNK